MITAFVINLDRSKDRWAAVRQSSEGTGIRIERVAALDGKTVDPADWSGIDIPRFEDKHGRRPLPGEYGCYRSHIAALDRIIDAGLDFAVVAEDDILFNSQLPDRINSLLAAYPSADVIRLVSYRTSAFVGYGVSDRDDKFGRTAHGPQGSAACYVVTLEGARKLRHALGTMWLPFDIALERGWDTGINVVSTRQALVEFQDDREKSTIAADGDYARTKLPFAKKLNAFWFRAGDYYSRMHYSTENGVVGRLTRSLTSATFSVIATVLALILVSAVWLESDAYRYAALIVALVGVWLWVADYQRPRMRWPEIICFGWAAYVGLRWLFDFASLGGRETGSAEGIYMLPILYSSVGYVYYRNADALGRAVQPFLLISLAALAVTVPFSQIQGDGKYDFLFTNNTIHSSVCGGLIVLAAVNYANQAWRTETGWRQSLWIGLASLIVALGAVGIFYAESKGVWVALAAASLAQLLFQFAGASVHRGTAAIAATLAVLLCGALVWRDVWAAVEPTATAALAVAQDAFAKGSLTAAVQTAISDGFMPISMTERLTLWVNALATWSQNLIFGNGLRWQSIFLSGPYTDLKYNLLHNGYLEIAVRYGVVGLIFYGVLFVWPVVQARRAWLAGIISREAYGFHLVATIFFLVTLMSNSNNRLAIGESFMLISAGFGFYCYFQLGRLARQTQAG